MLELEDKSLMSMSSSLTSRSSERRIEGVRGEEVMRAPNVKGSHKQEQPVQHQVLQQLHWLEKAVTIVRMRPRMEVGRPRSKEMPEEQLSR